MTMSIVQWCSYVIEGPFLNGFCLLVVPPLVLVLVTLLLCNRLGRGLGLPKLFRYDDGPLAARVFIGMGVASIFFQAFLSGYLFEEFATNTSKDRPPWIERNFESTQQVAVASSITEFAFYAAAMLVCLVLAGLVFWALLNVFDFIGVRLSVGKLARTPRSELTDRPPVSSPPFWVGFALGLTVLFAGTSVCFHVKPARTVAERVGLEALQFGGYGKAAARKELRRQIEETRQTKGQAAVADLDGKRIQRETQDKVIASYAPYYPVFGVYFLSAALVFVVYLVTFFQRRAGLFSPAVGIILLIHLVLIYDIVLSLFTPYPAAVKALVLLAILFLGGIRIYKLKFPGLDYRKPVRLADYNDSATGEVGQPLTKTRETPAKESIATPVLEPSFRNAQPVKVWRANGNKAPLVVICASGGGSRAAAWTTAVMGRLELEFQREGIALPYHARIVAGASGGLLGMTNYVANLDTPTSTGVAHQSRWPVLEDVAPYQMMNWLRATGIAEDWLTPICHRLLYFDIPALGLPFLPRRDRGRILESEWQERLSARMATPFTDLLPHEAKGWLPSLVFTPMCVEDGRQVVISNLDMHAAIVNAGAEVVEKTSTLSRSGLEFFRLFPKADRFQIGTAARMSATFPYLLPAVSLPTVPPRRMVDAGYYDNYGVQIAGAWLDAHSEWIRQNHSGVLFVQIRDSLSGDARRLDKVFPPDVPSLTWRSLHWLSSPFAGVSSARMASNTFRNDNLLDLLDAQFNERDKNFFRIASFEFDRDDSVSLSFRLTGDELRAIAESACAMDGIDRVLAWWKSR